MCAKAVIGGFYALTQSQLKINRSIFFCLLRVFSSKRFCRQQLPFSFWNHALSFSDAFWVDKFWTFFCTSLNLSWFRIVEYPETFPEACCFFSLINAFTQWHHILNHIFPILSRGFCDFFISSKKLCKTIDKIQMICYYKYTKGTPMTVTPFAIKR